MTFRLGDRALWRGLDEECVVIAPADEGFYRVRTLRAGLHSDPRIGIASAKNLIPLPNKIWS